LSNGYAHPVDSYRATGVYAQRDPVGNVPGVLVFYQQTYDGNVGPGDGSKPLQQSARSHAFALELDESILHGDVMFGIRPVEYLSGLQASSSGPDTLKTAQPHYGAFDIIARDPKFSPYLYAIFESGIGAASDAPYGQPAWTAQLRWAGPLFPAPALKKAPPTPSGVAAAGTTPAANPSAETSASPSPQMVQSGKAVYVANCAACHNANGTGGAGPSLHQVATTKTFAQTVDFIEKPSGAMPKLYPAPLSEAQVQEVAAYVRATFH
jgi:mono/diheme cytochrome c family protein